MTSKTKPSFLAGLKAAIAGNAPPDYEQKIAVAEQALATAREERDRAALEADLQLPGGPERLIRANDARQVAADALDTLQAAQRAWLAQERQATASARAAEAAREDKASRAFFDRQAAWAARGQEIIAGYVDWCVEGDAISADCHDQFAANERLRQDLQHYSIVEPIGREIARQAVAKVGSNRPLPPGANVLATITSDPREWPSLGEHFSDLAKAALA